VNRFFLHILFFFSFTSISIGQNQNFVYNGSFEEYSECPQTNELGNGQFERALGWFRPTLSTPDYFHRCNNGYVSVPHNFWGFQEAYHGDGYIGFVPISLNASGEYTDNEYLRTELLFPLKPCYEYQFTMYVSLANMSTHGIGQIGAWFSVENQFYETWLTLNVTPQIVYGGSPITDTINWTKVQGTFVASGFEKYLTIGYFQPTMSSDTLFIQDWGFGFAPYYYIDSVSVFELGLISEELCTEGELVFPNIITPNNDNSNDAIDATPYFVITEEIVILNRWGNVISVLTENNPIWNGTTQNGTPCTEGTYFYQFSYQWGNERKEKSGFIQLVR
jgi:gliding motility-associated-like protein